MSQIPRLSIAVGGWARSMGVLFEYLGNELIWEVLDRRDQDLEHRYPVLLYECFCIHESNVFLIAGYHGCHTALVRHQLFVSFGSLFNGSASLVVGIPRKIIVNMRK